MMKALSNRSAMFFMFGIYTMALLMKCMLSVNNVRPNMKQQEHVNTRKFHMNQNQKFIGWFCFSLHQLTVTRTHDDPCSALLGYLQRMTVDIWSTTTHTNINKFLGLTSSQDFRIIAKIWNQWKDTFNWSLMSHMWYVCLSVLLIHMRRNVWE